MTPLFKRLYHKPLQYTHKLMAIEPPTTSIPAFQVLDHNGRLMDQSMEPKELTKDHCQKMMKDMITLQQMDDILYNAQRQGRISFYITSTGEEATHIGSAAALHKDDIVYAQYRETGVLLYRGFTLSQFMNQCFGNHLDPGKGKQMPIHYGSPDLRFMTISSPLGTQIPQAAGAAYGLKLDRTGTVVICYFGEGAASEGDFHAGVNFAAVTESPVIFFCRNNQYAISTPTKHQYRGDGVVARASGYGIPGFRVDGNDLLATYAVTKAARHLAVTKNTPVLVEAITYRVGHHSTSDDSSTYRPKSEVDEWTTKREPVSRFRKYLQSKGWWYETVEEEDRRVRLPIREQVIAAMAAAEKELKAPISDMFDDVYEELTWALKEQKAELKAVLQDFPQDFPDLPKHKPWRD